MPCRVVSTVSPSDEFRKLKKNHLQKFNLKYNSSVPGMISIKKEEPVYDTSNNHQHDRRVQGMRKDT